MFGSATKPKSYLTKALDSLRWSELNFSQGKIRGFDLERNQQSRILLVGAGGLNSNSALGMVRKGIGELDIFDDDYVETKNLTRQFFYPRDIGKNKAIRLAKNLSNEGFFRTKITGYPFRFQEALELGFHLSNYDAIVSGVDNNTTRVTVAKFGLDNQIPVIHSAVSRDGNYMYCAVQETGKACFGCMFPHSLNDATYPCNLPGIIDVLQVVAGFVVFALDTILSERNREWNLKAISLDGSVPDSSLVVANKEDCPLCGSQNRQSGVT